MCATHNSAAHVGFASYSKVKGTPTRLAVRLSMPLLMPLIHALGLQRQPRVMWKLVHAAVWAWLSPSPGLRYATAFVAGLMLACFRLGVATAFVAGLMLACFRLGVGLLGVGDWGNWGDVSQPLSCPQTNRPLFRLITLLCPHALAPCTGACKKKSHVCWCSFWRLGVASCATRQQCGVAAPP